MKWGSLTMEFNETLTQIQTNLSGIIKWIGLIIEIITIVCVTIPKTRQVIKTWLKKVTGYDKIRKEISESRTETNEAITKMQDQVTEINNKLSNHIELDNLKLEGLMNSLKDSLLSSFHFYEDRGYITLEELDVLKDVYESYTALGGNGLIRTRWQEVICKLPHKPKKEKKS